MSLPAKLLAAAAFVTVLVLLGVTDRAVTGNRIVLPAGIDAMDDGPTVVGTPRRPDPDALLVARSRGFLLATTNEESLLAKTLGRSAASGAVLLLGNDRAAAVFWIDSPDVKRHMTSLKQALRSSFSGELRDLIDETQTEKGKPPRDILSFLDPAIRPDRVLVARVRTRLYEFHIAPGREKEIDGLLDALTE